MIFHNASTEEAKIDVWEVYARDHLNVRADIPLDKNQSRDLHKSSLGKQFMDNAKNNTDY